VVGTQEKVYINNILRKKPGPRHRRGSHYKKVELAITETI
jgi:hypothetical protein